MAATNLRVVEIWHGEPIVTVVLEHVVWLPLLQIVLVDKMVSTNAIPNDGFLE
jgi:hypothetical protein